MSERTQILDNKTQSQINEVETNHQMILKLKENKWVETEEAKPVPTTALNPKVVNKPAPPKPNPKKTGELCCISP